MFHSILIPPIILSSIWPYFYPCAVFLVILPFSGIRCPINKLMESRPMSIIIQPFSFVCIPSSMNESTPSVRLVVFPHSFIHRAICPNLNSLTMLHVFLNTPFAQVLCSIFQIINLSSVLFLNFIIHPFPFSILSFRSVNLSDFFVSRS